MKRIVKWSLSILMAMFSSGTLMAQTYPDRPIRIIIPNTSGDIADVAARVIGAEMSSQLKQPIIVETRPGAGQLIGSEFVAKSAPNDGYTLLVLGVPPLASAPATVKDLRFDPLKDLPPIITLFNLRIYLGAPRNQSWKTFEEFVAFARANPGKLNYGAQSVSSRLRLEAITQGRSIDVVNVPFSSAAPLATALAAGDVHLAISSELTLTSFRDKVFALGVSGDQRSAKFPDVPTLTELGFPQIRGVDYSMNARAGTPKAILDRLHAVAAAALEKPEVRAGLTKLGLDIVSDSQDAAAKKLRDEAAFWSGMAKKVGIKPE